MLQGKFSEIVEISEKSCVGPKEQGIMAMILVSRILVVTLDNWQNYKAFQYICQSLK